MIHLFFSLIPIQPKKAVFAKYGNLTLNVLVVFFRVKPSANPLLFFRNLYVRWTLFYFFFFSTLFYFFLLLSFSPATVVMPNNVACYSYNRKEDGFFRWWPFFRRFFICFTAWPIYVFTSNDYVFKQVHCLS